MPSLLCRDPPPYPSKAAAITTSVLEPSTEFLMVHDGARVGGARVGGAPVDRARVDRARMRQARVRRASMRRASTCAERACADRAERAAGQAGLRARKSTLWNEALSFGAALLCRMYMPEGRARKAFRMCCAAMACSRAGTRMCAMPASHVRTQSLLRVKHVFNSVQSAPESEMLIAADIPSSFATWGCLRSPVRMRTCVRTTLRRQATYTHAYIRPTEACCVVQACRAPIQC